MGPTLQEAVSKWKLNPLDPAGDHITRSIVPEAFANLKLSVNMYWKILSIVKWTHSVDDNSVCFKFSYPFGWEKACVLSELGYGSGYATSMVDVWGQILCEAILQWRFVLTASEWGRGPRGRGRERPNLVFRCIHVCTRWRSGGVSGRC